MKRVLSLLMAFLLLSCSLFACGEGEAVSSTDTGSDLVSVTGTDTDDSSTSKPDTDTDTEQSTASSEKTPLELDRTPTDETHLAMVCDGLRKRVSIYDLSACSGNDLDSCMVWSHASAAAGMKYREDTVFGDVIVLISGQNASMVTYPGNETLWSTKNAGNNGHCIEILPDGNIVTAASTGNTVRLFATSLLVENPKASVTCKTYELTDAHGVLWDPEYNVLWALGMNELVAFNVVGTGAEAELVRNEELSRRLPGQGGHALAADFSDKDYLWLSVWANVYRFDKKTGTFLTNYENNVVLNKANVKGFGNFLDGTYCYTTPNGGPGRKWSKLDLAEWSTDTIYFVYFNEEGQPRFRTCVSQTSAFYKVVPFYGKYQ